MPKSHSLSPPEGVSKRLAVVIVLAVEDRAGDWDGGTCEESSRSWQGSSCEGFKHLDMRLGPVDSQRTEQSWRRKVVLINSARLFLLCLPIVAGDCGWL